MSSDAALIVQNPGDDARLDHTQSGGTETMKSRNPRSATVAALSSHLNRNGNHKKTSAQNGVKTTQNGNDLNGQHTADRHNVRRQA
jgi:hypothetical protein